MNAPSSSRTLAHISDLHFGKEEPRVAEALLEELNLRKPDLVVVSGDLTQRAKRSEFIAAKTFFGRISSPKLIVPGNHDIPLFNPFARFITPLKRFREIIEPDLHPLYVDEQIAVVGLNTAKSLTFSSGWISDKQISALKETLCRIDERILKVAVMHHPFIAESGAESRAESEGRGKGRLISKNMHALEAISDCGVDLLLAGHLHQGYTGDVKVFHPALKSIVVAQAGTAISVRGRGEPNSYNWIRLDQTGDQRQIHIELRCWERSGFVTARKVDRKLTRD